MNIKTIPIDDLKSYAHNPKQHPAEQIEKIARSITEFGFLVPILIDADNLIIAGHGRLMAACKLGLVEVPTIRVDHLTEAQIQAYRIADNKLTESSWDLDMLESEIGILQDMDFDIDLTGFDDIEIGELFPSDPEPEDFDADAVMDDEGAPLVQTGELWILGDHRLLCGDSTKSENVERLMDGEKMDMMLTDPPYCSGGFQEAGKKAGSIGTRGSEMIHNDTLSTRGYTSLIRRVAELVDSGIVYIFTDWRMWVNLFDVSESCGYGVRNMIVWDKGTPGMGVGWRSQHELILCGIKVSKPFNPKKAQGNVISCARTGNVHHATEKPVELLSTIISVNDLAVNVCDLFGGSGSTLIACEQLDRRCYMMELDPHYCGVILDRWANYTKEDPIREDGMLWSELKESQQL